MNHASPKRKRFAKERLKLENQPSVVNPIFNLIAKMFAFAAETPKAPARKARFGQFVYKDADGVKRDQSERVNFERTRPKWIPSIRPIGERV